MSAQLDFFPPSNVTLDNKEMFNLKKRVIAFDVCSKDGHLTTTVDQKFKT